MRRVILNKGEQFSNKHLKRTGAFNARAMEAATNIIEQVREQGDAALRELTERFDGVAIALIAQLNPLASLIVAIFFGALTTGASSMQVGIMVPTAIVEIIRALIIIFSVAGVALIKLPKIQALIQQMGSGKAKKEEVNA